MKKLFLIGLKDVRLAFRDRAALILMLLAPFLLTLGLGFVTGRFSGGSSSGISHIPVALVNQDGKQIGNALVELFQSKDLDELIDPTVYNDTSSAYKLVDDNQAVAVIVIPIGFTDSIIPPKGQTTTSAPVQIELYSNPTAPTSVGVVKTILDEFLSQVEVGRVGGEVAVTQLVSSGRINIQDAQTVALSMGFSQANAASQSTSITLRNVTPSGEAVKFDVLALLAPSMALMFLMYTVSYGGRTLLSERNSGTLPRLLVSPTSPVQVLGGKMIGIFLTGAAQMFILIEGTTVLFQLQWGDPLAVTALVLAAVFGAVGWGMLITAVAKTPGQVNAIGSAIMLTFGILGGSFINMNNMPVWFRYVTKITPNAWGMDGFNTLALGGGLHDILTPVLALLAMGLVLFGIAVILFNRRGLIEK
ncbi:MAG TPA: ABC transporter permease [Anaerolineales bacterium]|nr:ABC transporter permease [Anaerolineales bacterium]